MFARHRDVLREDELGRMFAYTASASGSLGEYLRRYTNSLDWTGMYVNKYANAAPEARKPLLSAHYYDASGWTSMLSALSNSSNSGVIVINEWAAGPFSSAPAFYQGRPYQLVFGDMNSIESNQLYKIESPFIPRPVHEFAVDGRMHSLIEPLADINVFGYSTRLMPASSMRQLVNDILYMNTALHERYFHWGGAHENHRDVKYVEYYIVGWEKPRLLMLPTGFTMRMPPDTGDQKEETDIIIGYISNLMNNPYIEKPLDRSLIPISQETPQDKKDAEWLRGWLQNPDPFAFDAVNAPRIPAIREPKYSQSKDVRLKTYWREAKLDDVDNQASDADYLTTLELLEAIASKGLIHLLTSAPEASIFQRVRALYQNNLAILGNVRTPPGVFMTIDEIHTYLGELDKDENRLFSYQAFYDKLAQGDYKGHADKYSYDFPHRTPESMMWKPFIRFLVGLPETTQRRLYVASRWEHEDLPMSLSFSGLIVHGTEFSSDLHPVFYNTPLATAIEYGAAEYNPPWLSASDVALISDFLEGRVMPMLLYRELSQNAFNVLMTPRSFLDLYELIPFRLAINDAFVLGVPFCQQVRLSAEKILKTANLYGAHITRIEEFVQLIAS